MTATKPRTLFQTLTFKGVAAIVFAGTLFPYIAKPIENISIDLFPKNQILIVNGLSILGASLTVAGGTAVLKGRIDRGDVVTPKYVYGPDELPSQSATDARSGDS